jgi:hypothetical protein
LQGCHRGGSGRGLDELGGGGGGVKGCSRHGYALGQKIIVVSRLRTVSMLEVCERKRAHMKSCRVM